MKRVLLCALDWGLGHASRSIPIVTALQKNGAEVVLASSGRAMHLLKKEFPDLASVELPGYNPSYAVSAPMVLKLLPQLPRIAKVIRAESRATEKLVKDMHIDGVISDNRYGCWSKEVKSIFVTHQMNVLMPAGYGWLAPWVNHVCHGHIRHFSEVWIPDHPGSGLTDPFISNSVSAQKYIGWLSRFHYRNPVTSRYKVTAVISGPDPQRQIFKDMVVDQLKQTGWKALVVAGEPDKQYRISEANVEIVSHLPTSDLEEAMLASELIVSRSGYSTVMDLIALQRKAIFVPTPQQPEQIFLADHLMKKGLAYAEAQGAFSLARAVEKSSGFKGLNAVGRNEDLLEKEIHQLLL